jgi:hypothetical protein
MDEPVENITLDTNQTLPVFNNNEGVNDTQEPETSKGPDHPEHFEPPRPKSDEELAIISKIMTYKKTFKHECKHVDISTLEKLTYPQIVMKLDECKMALASRDKNKVHRIAFNGLLSFGEVYIAPSLKLDLKGLAATAAKDEDIMQCLDEIALLNDWGVGSTATPEMRLMFGLGMLAMQVNAHNKNKNRVIKPPDNEDETGDL